MQTTMQYENKSQCDVSLLLLQAVFMDVWHAKPEMMDALRKMPPNELIPLIKRLVTHGHITVNVDEKSLENLLNKCDGHRRIKNQLRTFVARGATVRLICKLFPVSKTDVTVLALHILGKPMSKSIPKPQFDSLTKIWKAWAELEQITSLRERYLCLADMFPEWSLASLDRALREKHKFSEVGIQDQGDKPVVIVRKYQAGVDGLDMPKIESLFEAIDAVPKLNENHIDSPIPIPKPKKVWTGVYPQKNKNHPWKKKGGLTSNSNIASEGK
ncbi:MAG: STY4526/YPO1902 family pathogenicity island replication protein [Sulfuricellaceae bacterium]